MVKKILLLLLVLVLLSACIQEPEPVAESIEEEEEQVGEEGVAVLESPGDAKERQISIVSEDVITTLQDYALEDLCTITTDKDLLPGSQIVTASFSFDPELEGKSVFLACDQFERYGLNEDTLYEETVPLNGQLSLTCDWGLVTTPTVYFLSASDGGEKDYCVYPITIVPLEEDEGACFSEERLEEMRGSCAERGLAGSTFSIPDANGCETVYCGSEGAFSCPDEDLLVQAEQSCKEEGNSAVRYSEDVAGLDFPCAQVRCSSCLDEEALLAEESVCEELALLPVRQLDEETGCSYVYCLAPE